MTPEDIDDLFRAKLDGHATPPGDDLWARLRAEAPSAQEAGPAPGAPAERLDQLFQQRLAGHATPPGRALWERLEDEHLRPRPRRTAVWWPMALAAAVALLLVAGGAGLWLGFPLGGTPGTAVATQPPQAARSAAGNPTSRPTPTRAPQSTTTNAAAVATTPAAQMPPTSGSPGFSKNKLAQATRPAALASTAPKASVAAPGPALRHLKGTSRQPDAAADRRPLVARTTTRPATAPAPTRPSAADEPLKTAAPVPVLAVVPTPPAPEIVPAVPVPAPGLARSTELITVDVRRGGDPATGAAEPTAATASAAPADRRRLGGRLLLQAGHLARGERVSLAEVTGLPENLTLRATVAGRRLTKSIQL